MAWRRRSSTSPATAATSVTSTSSRASTTSRSRSGTRRTDVGDRVPEVVVDVDDRGEGPVRADRGALTPPHLAELGGHRHVIGRGDRQRRTEERALLHDPAGALLEVRRDEHGDRELLAKQVAVRDSLLDRARPVHDAARRTDAQRRVERLLGEVRGDAAEELADLGASRQPSERGLDPRDAAVVEVEGCFAHGIQDTRVLLNVHRAQLSVSFGLILEARRKYPRTKILR